MDWDSLSEFSQNAIIITTFIITIVSLTFFREHYSFNIWPGVIRQTIAVGIFLMLQSPDSKFDHPELMIGIVIILTVITLYVNVRECGVLAGTGALLAQSALGFYIVIVLAILLLLFILARGNRKRDYR